MNAIFIESPIFERYRSEYLTDEEYQAFQNELLNRPKSGDVIKGSGGIRKVRYSQKNRGKGKRGGIRVIYYWLDSHNRFYLITLYSKGEIADLSPNETKSLKKLVEVWRDEESKKSI